MSAAGRQSAGEAPGAKVRSPFLEIQADREQEAMMLIGPSDELDEQFGPALEKGT